MNLIFVLVEAVNRDASGVRILSRITDCPEYSVYSIASNKRQDAYVY